jgi:hypothetical protein
MQMLGCQLKVGQICFLSYSLQLIILSFVAIQLKLWKGIVKQTKNLLPLALSQRLAEGYEREDCSMAPMLLDIIFESEILKLIICQDEG